MFQASDPGDARLRLFEREFLALIAEWSLGADRARETPDARALARGRSGLDGDPAARLRDLGVEDGEALEDAWDAERRHLRALRDLSADFADLGTLGSLP